MAGSLPPYGLVLELNSKGEMIKSWHGQQIGFVSEAVLYKNNLFIGSFINPFVAKIPY